MRHLQWKCFSGMMVVVSIWTCTLAGWAQIPCVPDVGVPQTNGPVLAIKQYGNRVYVGGGFTEIGGVARNGLAAFDSTTGAIDSMWDPNIGEFSYYLEGIFAIQIGGDYVYVGGEFETVNGGEVRNGLAAFPLADGSTRAIADPNWIPAGTATMRVFDLELAGNYIYAAGKFDQVNGSLARPGLAAFELAGDGRTGLSEPVWNPNLKEGAGSGLVFDILINNNTLYCGGIFDTVNSGIARNNLAAFELAGGGATGVVDLAWNPNVDLWVRSLHIHQNVLYVGGDFYKVNGLVARKALAAVELAGSGQTGVVDPDWDPQIDGYEVEGLVILDDLIYVGGHFHSVNGGVLREDFAAFELAGEGRTGLVSSDVIADMTNSLVLSKPASPCVFEYSGEGLLVGGYLESVNGQPYNFLVGFGSSIQSTAVSNWRVY